MNVAVDTINVSPKIGCLFKHYTFFHGATTSSGPGPPYHLGIRRTTLGMDPLKV
jgi:hypothetical protein